MANITVLALDPQTGDLCFDANGMLMLREDAEAIAQNVRNNLLTWKGEFPLNTDHGTDWERVVQQPRSEAVDEADSVVRSSIFQEPYAGHRGSGQCGLKMQLGRNQMKSTSKLGRDGRFWGLVMIAPTIIGLMILNIIPFFQTIYMSFSKTKAFGAYQFCGLENYLEMFRNAEFWKANWNSIYFCILTVPVGVFLALIVAVLLNAKIKGKTAFRAIFFLPMVVAPAAVAMVWKWIFNAEYGILNQVLGANIRWLTNPKIVLVTCAIVSIWSSIGYDAVLLLSGIQNISQSLYEAAELDGASKVRQFFSITLPMVSPTLFVVLIMRLMASLKVYDLIYMMVDQTNPALTSAQSLMYLFYRESFIAGNKGYASAIVVWTVLLIGLVTLVQFIGQKKWVNYEV